MALDYHGLTSSFADAGLAVPQATSDIVSNTDRRDVSEMLDLLSNSETPFIERVGWGPETGAQSIEWLSENLGPGYVVVASVAGSAGTAFSITTVNGITCDEAVKQLQSGSVLYGYSATDGEHSLMLVAAIDSTEITIEHISVNTGVALSLTAGDKLYVLGAMANEGSLPRKGPFRNRALKTNGMMILREDVNVTGSQIATDMYAINGEDRHQIKMRMLELVRGREKAALLGDYIARSATVAGVMYGARGFLGATSGDNIDTSTTALTESAVNDVVGECWENGAKNLTWFSSLKQARKFTQWDAQRIRMEPRDTRGGGHVTHYMTEAGVEMEVVAMKRFPVNMAFVIDVDKCRMRAKKGRKGIMEKLGKAGDFERWQILSEFSFEMRGYDLGAHGMFTALA